MMHPEVDAPLRPGRDAERTKAPSQAGDVCPHCGFALLRAEARGYVGCPVCGFSTAPPCT